MAAKSLLVRIGAQIKGLDQGLGKATKLIAGSTKRIARLGAVATGVAAAGLAVFTAGLVKSTQAAIAYDESLLKMSSAIQRAGGTDIPATVSSLQRLADEMQFSTRFTDDAILSAIGFGSSIGIQTSQLEAATKAAADMSAATGVDLNTALRAIKVAGDGSIGMLSKYGITLDKAKIKTGGLDFVIKALGDQMGGAAQQAGLSFQARLENIDKAQTNVLEATGQVITRNKTLNAILDVGTKALRQFGVFIEDNQEAMGEWVDKGFLVLVNVINFTIGALGFGAKAFLALKVAGNLAIAGLIDIFSALITVELKVLGAFEKLAKFAGLTKLSASIAGVKQEIAIFKEGVDATGDVFRQTAADGVESFKKVGEFTGLAKDKVQEFTEEVLKTKETIQVLGEVAVPTLERVAAGMEVVKKKTKETKDLVLETGLAMVDSFGAGFEAFVTGSTNAKGALIGFLSESLTSIEKLAIAQITAASATAAAEGAKSQAGIPIIGPILAPLAFAAMFALGRSALTMFHEGTDFVRRSDLLRLPGMRPEEGIAVLREGESVGSGRNGGRNGGANITQIFNTQTIGFPSRAQQRVYMNRVLFPAVARSTS